MPRPRLVVSPELALVDPDLAEAARRLLPEPGTAWWRSDDAPTAPPPAPRAPAPVPLRPVSPPTAAPPRQPRVGSGAARTLVLWCVVLALVAVGLGLAADAVREPARFEPVVPPTRPIRERRPPPPSTPVTPELERPHRQLGSRAHAGG